MKAKFAILLLSLFTLLNCAEKEWDIAPIYITIYAEDTKGNDLLSESNSNNILENDIKVVYNEMEFPLGEDMSEQTTTKAYLATLSGLSLRGQGDGNYLLFGEFDGAKSWDDTFEIYWGDGTSDEIKFTRDFRWKVNGNPDISNDNVYFNGVKAKEDVIIKIINTSEK
ncbi:MAG: hypothetical protein R3Y50_04580 [Rikenellaceae bacterium]